MVQYVFRKKTIEEEIEEALGKKARAIAFSAEQVIVVVDDPLTPEQLADLQATHTLKHFHAAIVKDEEFSSREDDVEREVYIEKGLARQAETDKGEGVS